MHIKARENTTIFNMKNHSVKDKKAIGSSPRNFLPMKNINEYSKEFHQKNLKNKCRAH